MRIAIFLLAAGCGGDCKTDGDCVGGDVCARDGDCLAPDEVVSARVTWTLDGQPPTAATCPHDLRIGFIIGSGRYESEFGFAPVPCPEGVFSVDKLPSFRQVELGFDVAGDFSRAEFADANGGNTVAFDLHP